MPPFPVLGSEAHLGPRNLVECDLRVNVLEYKNLCFSPKKWKYLNLFESLRLSHLKYDSLKNIRIKKYKLVTKSSSSP